jgi:hypothetical protein
MKLYVGDYCFSGVPATWTQVYESSDELRCIDFMFENILPFMKYGLDVYLSTDEAVVGYYRDVQGKTLGIGLTA